MGGNSFFWSKLPKKEIFGLVHLGDHVLFQGIGSNGVKLEL
jgi:hypothetical protein